MSDLPLTPLGLARCRDLVQLALGLRCAVNVSYKDIGEPGTIPALVLNLDPRRIRYELVITETSGLSPVVVHLLPSTTNSPSVRQLITVPAGGTIIIDRDFRHDLDAVCLPVYAINDATQPGTGVSNFSVRETFLTPLPVDEPVA